MSGSAAAFGEVRCLLEKNAIAGKINKKKENPVHGVPLNLE
jgi:hypothetical protein